ncbi:hypothetical protein GCM10010912_16930 [Paenibacillus albidus]|uniref:RNA polymerase alpha subunit C-terminal domain-containing protein n=1 Tax=Paenibacillus albidus TaxID=2041023 RepID=A0A917C583_9BACL|nr:hypothetical protein [Paenibacillus albidus]GGF72421.1 hypothetical protein GCM10010912_16930 [Paenibacillus albidus]
MLDLSLNQPLKTSLLIPEEYLIQDVVFLMEIDTSGNNQYATLKLINILRRNGLHTIEDILNSKAKHIQLMKGVGEKSFLMLLELLKEISKKKHN